MTKIGTVEPPVGGYPRFGVVRELPIEISGDPIRPDVEDLSYKLPYALMERGCQLLKLDPPRQIDPYVLYNEWGKILGVWEELPNLGTFYDFV